MISNPLLGDANNDNQVTGADLVTAQQNFGNVDPDMPIDGLFLGDANDDGQVTGLPYSRTSAIRSGRPARRYRILHRFVY